MAKKYVISTLNADNLYTKWETPPGGGKTILRQVLVRGKAGVARHAKAGSVIVPGGTSTEVSDTDAAFLAEHPQFLEHQKRGHVRITNTAVDPDKSAKSMSADQGGRPRNEDDVKSLNKKDTDEDEKVTAKTNKK